MRIKIDTAARSPEELLERWKSQEAEMRRELNIIMGKTSRHDMREEFNIMFGERNRLAQCLQELQACLITK